VINTGLAPSTLRSQLRAWGDMCLLAAARPHASVLVVAALRLLVCAVALRYWCMRLECISASVMAVTPSRRYRESAVAARLLLRVAGYLRHALVALLALLAAQGKESE
jgi:sterol desaturase/sphingolipid hydroxylase (fatty acid hydroxylase superfamily)